MEKTFVQGLAGHRKSLLVTGPLKPETIVPENFAAFSAFTEYMFSAWRDLSCWMEIETYKMLPAELLKERGQQIWDKYFVLESDFFLDQEEVEDPKGIKNRLRRGDPDAFNDVQESIFKKIKKDMFSSFIMSEHGRRLANDPSNLRGDNLRKKNGTTFALYIKQQQEDAEDFAAERRKNRSKSPGRRPGRSFSAKDERSAIERRENFDAERSPRLRSPSLGKMKAMKVLAGNAVAKKRVRPEWLKLDNPRLEDAVEDRDCIFWFREYLHSIKANESLSFWLEAEIFKSLPEKQRKKRAPQIFKKYFDEKSPYVIYIDNLTTEDTANMEEMSKAKEPRRDMFSYAQSETWYILSSQCFVNFRSSTYWTSYLKQIEGTEVAQPRSGRRETLENLDELMKRGASLNLDQSPTPTFMSIDDIFYNGDLAQSFFEFLALQDKARLAEFVFDAAVYRLSNDPPTADKCLLILREYFLGEDPLDADNWSIKDIEQEAERDSTRFTLFNLENAMWRKLKFDWYIKFLKSKQYEQLTKSPVAFLTPPVEPNKPSGSLSPRADSKILPSRLVTRWELLIRVRDTRVRREVVNENERIVSKKLSKAIVLELSEAISNVDLMMTFREYLYSIYCNENFSFWIDAEIFSRARSEDQLKEKARAIWVKYFDVDSELAITLDDNIDLQAIKSKLDNPVAEMFKAAQDNVWSMLENVCWPNFLTSPMFEGYIKDKSKPRPTRSTTIDNLMKLQLSLQEKDSIEEENNNNQETKRDSVQSN